MSGSLFLLKNGTVVQSNYWGKSATVFFVLGILMVFPWHENAYLRTIGQYVVAAAVVLSLIAMVNYVMMGVNVTKSVKKEKAEKMR